MGSLFTHGTARTHPYICKNLPIIWADVIEFHDPSLFWGQTANLIQPFLLVNEVGGLILNYT